MQGSGTGKRLPAKHPKVKLRLKSVVDTLEGEPGRITYFWDAEIRGFGLRIDAQGRRRFIFDYRFAGRQRRMILDTSGLITPEGAHTRATAASLKLSAAPPIDPLKERQDHDDAERLKEDAKRRARANAMTVDDVAAKYLANLKTEASPRWCEDATDLYARFLAKPLGKKLIAKVDVEDCESVILPLAVTPYTGNNVRAVLSAIFNLAIKKRWRPLGEGNPLTLIDPFPTEKRTRHLLWPYTDENGEEIGTDEWTPFGRALQSLYDEYPYSETETVHTQLRAIHLMLLTGARHTAMIRRKWSDIDWKARVMRIPDDEPDMKGAETLYLGPEAVALLRSWDDGTDGYIFPGQRRRIGARTRKGVYDARPFRAQTHVASVNMAFGLLRERAALEDFRPHDLRRSFSTVGADLGVSQLNIDALLGHKVQGIAAHYVGRADASRLRDAAIITKEISKRLQLDAPASSNVIDFPKRRKA